MGAEASHLVSVTCCCSSRQPPPGTTSAVVADKLKQRQVVLKQREPSEPKRTQRSSDGLASPSPSPSPSSSLASPAPVPIPLSPTAAASRNSDPLFPGLTGHTDSDGGSTRLDSAPSDAIEHTMTESNLLRVSESSSLQGRDIGPMITAKASVMTARTTTSSRRAEIPLELAFERIQDLERHAEVVKGNGRKNPVSNRLFGRPQDRYLAVIPADEERPDVDAGDTWRRWRNGFLGYWENRDCFERRSAPKGIVPLMHIMQVVQTAAEKAASVSVIYQDPKTGNRDRLDLSFDGLTRAEEWKTGLKGIRSSLNVLQARKTTSS
mmetsp:Transcript_45493/g.97493  ORF Transcript_45493/g.97493 Transcript_45493/m.97493 type:complete len:322 (+) Transcript_45493:292-1257(+)|eukprot:CAMPEP_0206574822 /NCGR_PEP_ID=MMETSP0325_2-20121206/29691_1 /ASSEMBLY_ACC=CAM_ASM_000347 /TAXON_ID=2866 /ORGANISM="Crypthecodinium cohnii, Strain Seligo" /LENGTH=321 /DNA_ID=CAMNT_0054079533 /DNA_START=224 /DNA_END=1186 /DNA_ORIENTATION=+